MRFIRAKRECAQRTQGELRLGVLRKDDMKTLDYFCEEILFPFIQDVVIYIAVPVLNTLLMILLWTTLPIWILPYLILRKKRNK